jgi:hypothetical protein
LIFHPFDGFYEAKHRGKGSLLLATLLFILYGITQIVSTQYTGFINNYNPVYGIESSELFLSGTLPLVLFFLSNYAVTMLMNGNGRFQDIYLVTCYALTPLILFSLLSTLISNVLIIEELPILMAFYWIGVLWFLFLLFCGLCVAHEYTAGQNIAALLCTVIAAIIILFLTVLVLTLLDRVTGFVDVVFIEISRRRR